MAELAHVLDLDDRVRIGVLRHGQLQCWVGAAAPGRGGLMRLNRSIPVQHRLITPVQDPLNKVDTVQVSSTVMDLRLLRYFVTVAEELHFRRAAERLQMSQPPLSRAIKTLEADFGTVLLRRSASGVSLTAAGEVLYREARSLLEQAGQIPARVAAAAGDVTLSVGTLSDTAEQAGPRLVAAFRERHPAVHVRVRETDLGDPTAGLRAGRVDVVLTRTPFEDAGISTHVLRYDPVGVVLRADDPLAGRDILRVRDLDDRPWFRLPEGTDPVWRAFWNATTRGAPHREGPEVRTIQECLQAVLWNGTIGLSPLGHAMPDGLVAVPLADLPPSPLVVAWNSTNRDPLIHSFIRVAAAIYRPSLESGQAPAGSRAACTCAEPSGTPTHTSVAP
ncbi:LysR family transcriptional regulator [Nocardia sp. NPDC019395]|uniref:LysR family transcriptional regulator n=1 Tax=Nocardia sp. NPDC019395 TaxID=3154686 RepID=UPI0033C4E5C2